MSLGVTRSAHRRQRPTAGTPGTGELTWRAMSRGSVLTLDLVGTVWCVSISFCVTLGDSGVGTRTGERSLFRFLLRQQEGVRGKGLRVSWPSGLHLQPLTGRDGLQSPLEGPLSLREWEKVRDVGVQLKCSHRLALCHIQLPP